jgi:tetratricopeptide (TPR) repeat protein
LALARYNYGNCLAQAGRLPEAIDQLAEAVRLSPSYAEAHYNLGRNLADAGRYAEALGHLETYLKLDPDPPDGAFIAALVSMLRRQVERSTVP